MITVTWAAHNRAMSLSQPLTGPILIFICTADRHCKKILLIREMDVHVTTDENQPSIMRTLQTPPLSISNPNSILIARPPCVLQITPRSNFRSYIAPSDETVSDASEFLCQSLPFPGVYTSAYLFRSMTSRYEARIAELMWRLTKASRGNRAVKGSATLRNLYVMARTCFSWEFP